MFLVHLSFILREKGYFGLLRFKRKTTVYSDISFYPDNPTKNCSYYPHKFVYFPTSERDDRHLQRRYISGS